MLLMSTPTIINRRRLQRKVEDQEQEQHHSSEVDNRNNDESTVSNNNTDNPNNNSTNSVVMTPIQTKRQKQQQRIISSSLSSSSFRIVLLYIVDNYIAILIIIIGLIQFTSSFFLAKGSMSTYRSQCTDGILLLQNELHMSKNEIQQLIQQNVVRNSTTSTYNAKQQSTNIFLDNSCWMDRYVDSIVFIVIDALRFDFAYYNLPNSIGKYLNASTSTNTSNTKTNTKGRLYQFVADPPTVTMQRLKALTTGGLPTFADISANFGGGTIDEDSWIYQLLVRQQQQQQQQQITKKTNTKTLILTESNNQEIIDTTTTTTKKEQQQQQQQEDLQSHPAGYGAFVGDDTWLDLYPNIFTESYPYPSFNTRDLDTVDNGCLHHIPNLLTKLKGYPIVSTTTTTTTTTATNNTTYSTNSTTSTNDNINNDNTNTNNDQYDVIVIHFLGVDHVGHTYGPHNKYMDTKLKQMDTMLTNVFNTIDTIDNDSCHIVHVLGDHGMTPDGNHGGGTVEEINAALFVYMSSGCHTSFDDSTTFLEEHYSTNNFYNTDFNDQRIHTSTTDNRLLLPKDWHVPNPDQFTMIHQIDLVPTISILLGIPIPYANLGSIVPGMLPRLTRRQQMQMQQQRMQQSRSNNNNDNTTSIRQQQQRHFHHQHRATVTSLALNSAQVWRYYTEYSNTINRLPNLDILEKTLHLATSSWKATLQLDNFGTDDNNNDNDDTESSSSSSSIVLDRYMETASLFKLFLSDALELGQRVWTRFDTNGMILGIVLIGIGLLLYSRKFLVNMIVQLYSFVVDTKKDTDDYKNNNNTYIFVQKDQYLEIYISAQLILFQCGMLSFSNSYILEEDHSCMFGLAVIALVVAHRVVTYSTTMTSNTTTAATTATDTPTTLITDGQLLLPLWIIVMIIPICSRMHELLVTGHGLDPSIRNTTHYVHRVFIFVPSCCLLLIMRWITYIYLYRNYKTKSDNNKNTTHTTNSKTTTLVIGAIIDTLSILFLMLSWIERRSIDVSRNGYMYCSIAIILLCIGLVLHMIVIPSIYCVSTRWVSANKTHINIKSIGHYYDSTIIIPMIVCKFLIAIMIYTGPSTGTSMVLYSIQVILIHQLTTTKVSNIEEQTIESKKNDTATTTTTTTTAPTFTSQQKNLLSPFVVASMWKLITRHAFFATNHGCFFNRLQYSSAFVTSNEFNFVTGGIALATNTFGWDIVGILIAWYLNQIYYTTQPRPQRQQQQQHNTNDSVSGMRTDTVFRIYCTFQYIEALCSCISVSILRRHLMVWDIYAPHFLFTVCFTTITAIIQTILMILC